MNRLALVSVTLIGSPTPNSKRDDTCHLRREHPAHQPRGSVCVVRHVALSLSNREIGRMLDISVEAVKERVQNLLRKLEANDRTEAAVWAVTKGLV